MESVATQPGEELHQRDCRREDLPSALLSVLSLLISPLSCLLYLLLLFSSSPLLSHEPFFGSTKARWVQPLPFAAASTELSCAFSQGRSISAPTKTGP